MRPQTPSTDATNVHNVHTAFMVLLPSLSGYESDVAAHFRCDKDLPPLLTGDFKAVIAAIRRALGREFVPDEDIETCGIVHSPGTRLPLSYNGASTGSCEEAEAQLRKCWDLGQISAKA